MWPETAGHPPVWNYMLFQSTHAVDLARHLGGEISRLHTELSVGKEGRFAIACALDFAGGAAGTLTLTGCAPILTSKVKADGHAWAHLRLVNLHTLHFETATAESGYAPSPDIPGQYWAPATRDNAGQRGGYWGQMQAFAWAVRSGKSDTPTLRDACRAMQLCEAMLDSICRGEPVRNG